MSEIVRRSKFLSLVLRHQPGKVGITLDTEGWVDVETLLTALRGKDRGWSRETLNEVVAENNKKRFEFDASGKRIRARQGHTVEVDLGYTPETPPDTLYHGTPENVVSTILADGIKKMSRHAVHLSPDQGTAVNVGSRRGKAVVLAVDARRLHESGVTFFRTDNNVWLTEFVPPEFVRVL